MKQEFEQRPILFKGPLVRSILADEKTETRRLKGLEGFTKRGDFYGMVENQGRYCAKFVDSIPDDPVPVYVPSPFGRPGDQLWVRETWGYRGGCWRNTYPEAQEIFISYQADGKQISFIRAAGNNEGLPRQNPPPYGDTFESQQKYHEYLQRWWKQWRPAIFLPRWASRVDLKIKSITVERVQDITEKGAAAEGMRAWKEASWSKASGASLRDVFEVGWQTINGREAWTENPWCWRVRFERVPVQ